MEIKWLIVFKKLKTIFLYWNTLSYLNLFTRYILKKILKFIKMLIFIFAKLHIPVTKGTFLMLLLLSNVNYFCEHVIKIIVTYSVY